MTEKQKLFCEYYIESLNVTESARKAGYSYKTAANVGHVLIRRKDVNEYISKQMKKKTSVLIASQDEILATLTNIMRGKMFLERTRINKTSGELETYKEYPDFSDITRAAELLGKRYNMWNDRQIVEVADADIHVTIEGDVEQFEGDVEQLTEGDED